MKKFSNYQYVEGESMNERDKQEVGSKFWNKGKWDNFVLPFLPDDCSEMTLIDMGCNAGVFLKLAEDKGFKNVIGVDSNKDAIKKAVAYKERNGGKYDIQRRYMERSIEHLPVADYTVLAMSHYYFFIPSWLEYLDKLIAKTRYCIIVTAKKRRQLCKASADTKNIRDYFKFWEETGNIPELSLEGDPFPRQQWSFCFKSPLLERISIDSLDCGNEIQDGFYEDIEKGINPIKTKYYNHLKNGRRKKWPEKRTIQYVNDKALLFKDVKKNGMLKPITINFSNRIIDGNHRYAIMKYLEYKSVIIRRVL